MTETTPTPPAVSEALREAVAPYIALFDVAYRKACEGSMEPDWCNAALLGQQMRNAFFKAIGPDGPIASEIARRTGERDAAREDHVRAEAHICALEVLAYIDPEHTWKDAAIKERVARVAAEAETARLRAALEGAICAMHNQTRREQFNAGFTGQPSLPQHPVDAYRAGEQARAALTSQEQADA